MKRAGTLFHGVIFDVDGVLVASPHERAWRESLQELMAAEWSDLAGASQYRPEGFTSLFYQRFVAGKPRLSGAQAALEQFGVPDAEGRAIEYANQKQARLTDLIEGGEFAAFPDAVRFTVHLKSMGLRLAIASSSKNSRGLLQQIDPYAGIHAVNSDGNNSVERSSLLDFFEVDVSGRDLPKGKPHPAIFLQAAEELHLQPGTCVVVEDAPSGVLAAKAGRMCALGVARAGDEALLLDAGADLVVSSLDQVDLAAFAAGRLEALAGSDGETLKRSERAAAAT